MPRTALLGQLEREWQAAVASLPPEQFLRPDWLRAMTAPMPWRPAALFAELEDTRWEWQQLRQWQELLDRADEMVNRGWTYKDLLAHLASWAVEFHKQMAIAAAGEEFGYEILFEPKVGPTEWNAVEVAKRRAITLAEIFDQFDEAFRQSQELVLSVPPERLLVQIQFPIRTGSVPLVGDIPRIVGFKCFHNRYHFAQIRARIAGLPEGPQGREG